MPQSDNSLPNKPQSHALTTSQQQYVFQHSLTTGHAVQLKTISDQVKKCRLQNHCSTKTEKFKNSQINPVFCYL